MAATIAKRGRFRQRGGRRRTHGNGMEIRRKTVEQLVGARIRARRTELGLIQGQLAAALGLSYQQIQKYENGSTRITVDRLVVLAERLEVPVSYFLAGLSQAATGGRDGIAAEPPGPGHARAGQELARGFAQIRDEGVRGAIAGLVRTLGERRQG
jgi:transcriptional regulator with XRE-family HTH domain